MGTADIHKSRRIARNTMMLYVRMFALLIVGLYTSRVILAALGENDFGIYNVVGGVVAMFTVISGALSSAVTRFITFEMGKGEGAQLNKVYSTAVTIQLILCLIVGKADVFSAREATLDARTKNGHGTREQHECDHKKGQYLFKACHTTRLLAIRK